MSSERRVYLLNPQVLPPETIAVAFAKTSRSPQSFGEIAAELTKEKSAEFHEKWVVGYGHASVAEHAILHIAIENVSRLAVEILESNRLASYTEKSTRYQKWTANGFFIPPEIKGHSLEELYSKTCQKLFTAYEKALDAVRQVVSEEQPRQPGESDSAWERRLRTEYVDVCRFLLPAASIANVGMTINARALEHALCKMLSHPLSEVRTLGQEIKQVSQAEVPTLVKYANPQPYLEETPRDLKSVTALLPLPVIPVKDWCKLAFADLGGEDRVLAAAIYGNSNYSYAQVLTYVHDTPPEERQRLAEIIFNKLDCHSLPLREMEHTSYTFDIVLDQGAYFELKRHRMMTQTPQPLTTHLGYAVPRRITTANLEYDYCRIMDEVQEVYQTLASFNPEIASYVVPNGYNRRVLLTLNFRNLFHLVSLRSAPNAHFSMRRTAYRMAEIVKGCSPILGNFLRTSPGETWQEIEEQNFSDLFRSKS
jgi:thymidylate synthase ThyX